MSASIIDLAAVRDGIELDRDVFQSFLSRMVSLAISEAERAFDVSGPLAATDLDLARAINRVVWRKLRAKVRRRLRVFPHYGAEARAATLEAICNVFDGRLLFLIDERDRTTGDAA